MTIMLQQSGARRDYASLAAQMTTAGDRLTRMRAVVDVVWEQLAHSGISWVGFYLSETEPEATGFFAPLEDGSRQLVLGPRRDKPACSPIGLHGACGRTFLSRAALVVRDVRELGPNYIACDPRDQSEVVIPCLNADGTCWGVLDLDSYDVGAFDDNDVAGLTRLLCAAGLTHAG